MEEKQNPFLYLLNYSALAGIILVALAVLFYLIDMSQSTTESWLTYIVLAGLLYKGIANYRDNLQNGFISFGKSLGVGFRISLYSAIILGFYYYILLQFIDSSLIDVMMETTYNTYLDAGIDEEEAAKMMESVETMMSPGFIAMGSVFSYTLFGTVLSLVLSFFLKKEAPLITED